MEFCFTFKTLGDVRELNILTEFLRLQTLGYKGYQEWVDKTRQELFWGVKQVIMAFSEEKLVGDLIHQKHKKISLFYEIKNLRIHPDLRERGFARFMIKQAEAEAKKTGDLAVICDARADRPELTDFMEQLGYQKIATVPLYERNEPDTIMVKFLTEI